jgi:hypothetical protein
MTERKTLWTWGMPTPDLGRTWRRDGSRYYVDVTDEYVPTEQLRGAVELLRELADEAAKAVCEPARFDQHNLGSVVARARRHLGGQ